jgi:phage terminase large subunit-like protein
VDKLFEQRQIAAAVNALRRRQIISAFDPAKPESRPNKKQQIILDDIGKVKYRYITAGNRCLAEGTLVMTPKGPVPIEEIRPGDKVYDEFGKEISVLKTFENGSKEVVELTNRGQVWGESTDTHTWLTDDDSRKTIKERKVSEFRKGIRILRQEVSCPLGEVEEPHAYAIGALLGDGCSRQGTLTNIHISSADEGVVKKVQDIVGKSYRKQHEDNYTWIIEQATCNHYKEWCHKRYAHEKIVDLNIVKRWNRNSLLSFVAGLIDTDGSVYVTRENNVCIQIGMQAKSVIEACKYAFLALWNLDPTIGKDDRDKYINGPVYYARVANNAYSLRALRELTPYLQVDRKKYQPDYDKFISTRTNSSRIGIKLGQRRITNTYDIHVDSKTNLYLLANGLVTHNSGKSALVARELAWILTDTHPTWKPPPEWENDNITVIIACQDLTLGSAELWSNKIAPFLDLTEWKLEKQGNTLKRIHHKETGAQIIFVSHSDSSEKNRKHMQGYTAHYVWLDEMPSSVGILEELQARIATTNGIFIASFTPKFRSDKIRKIVDQAKAPYAKKYRLSMLDNPRVDADAEMARLHGQPRSVINTVLYGDWSTGENAAYVFNYDTMTVDALPSHYHSGWRHIESVDPALRSKCGYTLWAEDPNSGTWYLVNDKYIQGDTSLDPESLFHEIKRRSTNYNITKRVSDSMAWYTSVASKHGVSYTIPYDKNNRKEDLMKGLQKQLSSGKIKIGRWCSAFLDEIQSCQFREDSDKLINASSYHTLDCAQYFCDSIPKYDASQAALPWQALLHQSHQKRLEAESQQIKMGQKTSNKPGQRRVRVIGTWGRSRKLR